MILHKCRQSVKERCSAFMADGNGSYSRKMIVPTFSKDYDLEKAVFLEDDVVLIPILSKGKFAAAYGCVPEYIALIVDNADDMFVTVTATIDSLVYDNEVILNKEELSFVYCIMASLPEQIAGGDIS